MKKKREEPIFWLDNKCPACGHCSPLIYKPDLLKGNIDCECQSKFNMHRINSPCIEQWSVAIDDVEAQHILDLLRLAERQDELYKEIARNCKLLGGG